MPVIDLDDAVALAQQCRAAGRVVVFTNGVFDLLHPGHIRYLRAARREGDLLIVGTNSDRSVRSNKGPTRPIVVEKERAEILAALEFVDAVLLFDEDTPEMVIRRMAPDVLVKGADWEVSQIVGREIVEARGGRVIRMPVESGFSTTAIIERILRQHGKRNIELKQENSEGHRDSS